MRKLFLLTCVLVFLTGCSSYLSQAENVSQQKKAYDKILVVARTDSKAARVLFEREVAQQLQTEGVTAEASVDHIAELSLQGNSGTDQRQAIRNTLVNAGYDGVIVTNLIDSQEYTDVIPGTPTTAYVGSRYGRFGQYYGYYPITTWGPDYIETGTRYVFESTLYALGEGDAGGLQWVGNFRLKDPTDIRKAVEKYASELTGALLSESILAE